MFLWRGSLAAGSKGLVMTHPSVWISGRNRRTRPRIDQFGLDWWRDVRRPFGFQIANGMYLAISSPIRRLEPRTVVSGGSGRCADGMSVHHVEADNAECPRRDRQTQAPWTFDHRPGGDIVVRAGQGGCGLHPVVKHDLCASLRGRSQCAGCNDPHQMLRPDRDALIAPAPSCTCGMIRCWMRSFPWLSCATIPKARWPSSSRCSVSLVDAA